MSGATLLNSKSEWNNARIPRIIVEEGERQVEDIESGLANKNEKVKHRRQVERKLDERERKEKRKPEIEKNNEPEIDGEQAKKKRKTERGKEGDTGGKRHRLGKARIS